MDLKVFFNTKSQSDYSINYNISKIEQHEHVSISHLFKVTTFGIYFSISQNAVAHHHKSLSLVRPPRLARHFGTAPCARRGAPAYAGVRYIFLGEHHAVAGHVSPWATIFITNRSAARGWQSNTSCVSMFPAWRPSKRARGRASRRPSVRSSLVPSLG